MNVKEEVEKLADKIMNELYWCYTTNKSDKKNDRMYKKLISDIYDLLEKVKK